MLGYTLAESIFADHDYPPFDRVGWEGDHARLVHAHETGEFPRYVHAQGIDAHRGETLLCAGTTINISALTSD